MAEVVLIHSALGLRRGVLADAERLRTAGHVVHTPDLLEGAVFDDIAEATAHRDSLGVPELMHRATAAVAALHAPFVVAGYSMGAAAAQFLAAHTPGVQAAILMHGALPLHAVGGSWPPNVPVAIHHGRGDPLVDARVVDAFARDLEDQGAYVERFEYPVNGHLFADPDLPEFDSSCAELMWRRVLSFIETGRREQRQAPRPSAPRQPE